MRFKHTIPSEEPHSTGKTIKTKSRAVISNKWRLGTKLLAEEQMELSRVMQISQLWHGCRTVCICPLPLNCIIKRICVACELFLNQNLQAY